MALDAFDELRGRPPKIDRTPLTCKVVKVDDEGAWVAPLDGDMRSPIGPCRGATTVDAGDIVLLVWTQELPWVYKGNIPVADAGESSSTEVVRADDPRLSDARAPVGHVHAQADVAGLVAALNDLAERLAILERPGTIAINPRSTTPTGYLPCNGAAISRETYAALFAEIDTTWGAGDGSTTFNVPDFRGRGPIGANGTYPLASTGGAASVVLTSGNLPPHKHDLDVGGSTPGTNNAVLQRSSGSLVATINAPIGSGPGSADPVPTLDPYAAVNYMIKT